MTTLIAFHGKKEIKDKYVAKLLAHEKADEIKKGYYWENGKGCAVGCTIEGSDHSKYETELGLPEWLARLEDTIFEAWSARSARSAAESAAYSKYAKELIRLLKEAK